jgi:hypothetical protein
MRRLNVNATLGFRIDPSADDATAWKHESMRTVAIHDG